MSIAYLVILLALGFLVWSASRRRITPEDVLRYRVEKQSRHSPPEVVALAGSAPLEKHRASYLALLGFVFVLILIWGAPLIGRIFAASGEPVDSRTMTDGLLACLAVVVSLFVGTAFLIQLFTDVDARGVHRPSWAGGAFIPWAEVSEVSIAGTYLVTVLELRAGQRRVLLALEQFRNPAVLLELLRRNVPADRLNGI